MKQYLRLLHDVAKFGYETPLARDNMPATRVLPNVTMEFDLNDGIPLLTSKAVHMSSVFAETLWILRGEQNIKYLLDNNCNVWNANAYKWYLEKMAGYPQVDAVSLPAMLRAIKDEMWFACVLNDNIYVAAGTRVFGCPVKDYEEGCTPLMISALDLPTLVDYTYESVVGLVGYSIGDMGGVYGVQWRNWNTGIIENTGTDQFAEMIDRLIKNPYGRYAKITAWNPEDMPNLNVTGQPNCHGDMQISCYPENGRTYFELLMVQRSCDLFLGVPFNLMQYTIIGTIIQELTGYIFTKFRWVGANTHIYLNQMDAVEEQLSREPIPNIKHELQLLKPLKTVKDIMTLTVSDFRIIDNHGDEVYHNRGKIAAQLSVGLKKE